MVLPGAKPQTLPPNQTPFLCPLLVCIQSLMCLRTVAEYFRDEEGQDGEFTVAPKPQKVEN
jgi:hypothetical protein